MLKRSLLTSIQAARVIDFGGDLTVRTPTTMIVRVLRIAAAVILLGDSRAVQAQIYWSASSGDWSMASNWGGQLPSSSNTAYIVNGGTATISHSVASCGSLSLGNSAGNGSVQMTGGLLKMPDDTGGSEYVGDFGIGTFTQTGGTNNTNPHNIFFLYLGANPGGDGTYNLNGSGQIFAFENVGYGGRGVFSQFGGTNHATGLQIGYLPAGVGTYNLNGNGRIVAESEDLGRNGVGIFNQSAGTNNVTYLYFQGNAGSSGTYNLDGSGVLSTTQEIFQSSGPSSFVQTGGTNSTAQLYLSSGTYNLAGGKMSVSDAAYFGQYGKGLYNLTGSGQLSAANEYVDTVTHSGGTNSVTGYLYVYNMPSRNSVYTLSGSGFVSAANECIGYSGSGTFTQTGGFNSVSMLSISNSGFYQLVGGTLQINGGVANSGVFTVSGTAATLSPNCLFDLSNVNCQNLGAASVRMGSSSLLIVPPGFDPYTSFASFSSLGLTHTTGTTLTVSAGKGFVGSGSVDDPVICQGTIMAASGGSINLDNGLFLSGNGSVNLGSNGNLTSNDLSSGISSGSLSAAYQYVGAGGTGSFNHSGGTSSISSLYLGNNANDSGTYSLSGSGVLSESWREYLGYSGSGTFNQSGGTHTTGQISPSLYLGYNPDSTGTYNLSGKGLLSSIQSITIGYSGTGVFTQSGGTNAAIGNLYLGYNAGSVGVYNLSGSGLLSLQSEFVGGSGTATFTQSGGTNNCYSVTVGRPGTYNLDGGLLIVCFLGSAYGTNGSADFNFSGGTLRAGTSSTMTLPMTLTGSSGKATIDTGGCSLTLAGALTGAGSLAKVGSGTLILAASNGYAGVTSINGGTLSLDNSAALAGGGSIAFGTGTLQYTPSNAIDYSSRIANSAGPISIDTNGLNVTFASSLDISNSGGLTKVGSGTLTLAASNGFTGTTAINGGVLNLANSAALPASGSISFCGGTLLYTASNTIDYSGRIGGSTGPISIDTNGQSIVFTSILDNSNTGGLIKAGSGTLMLQAANAFSGITSLGGGTLVLDVPLALGRSTLDTTGTGTLSFGSLITATLGGLTGSGALSLKNTASAAVAVSVGDNNARTRFSGTLMGPGSLIKTGTAMLTLVTANTYSGDTLISGGMLTLVSPLALQNSTLDTSGSGTLNFGSLSAVTLGGLTSTGVLSLTRPGNLPVLLNVGNNNVSTTYSGILNGLGSLSMMGSGSLTLTGSNTYTGGTSVIAGTLEATGTASLSGYATAGKISVGKSGTLVLSAGSGWDSGSIAMMLKNNGGHFAGGSFFGIDTTDGNFLYDSNIAGNMGLTKLGSNTLVLTGSNTYTGSTVVSAGFLDVASLSSLPDRTSLTVGAAATSIFGGVAVPAGSTPVPEPSTEALFGFGAVTMCMLAFSRRRKKHEPGQSKSILMLNGRMTNDNSCLSYASFVPFLGLAMALSFFMASPLKADTYKWNVPWGDWTDYGNWLNTSNTGSTALPTTSDAVYITDGGTADVTQLGETCGTLSLGTGGQSGTVEMIDGSLFASSYSAGENVGYTGKGTLLQSGGTNSLSVSNYCWLNLGYKSGGTGSYVLSGGLLSAWGEGIGGAGPGSFVQSGGTNSVSNGGLGVGSTSGNSTYTLSSGLLYSTGSERIGFYTPGSFTQTGGTNSITNEHYNTIYVAMNTQHATFNLNGGLLITPGLTTDGQSFPTFNFNGGTLQANGNFSVNLPITLGASGGGATFDTAGFDVTLLSPLSGSGSLTHAGSGTLALTSANTFTGNTLIRSGTLEIENYSSLQQSTLNISGSGAVEFGSLRTATLGGLTGSGVLGLCNTASEAVPLSVGNNNANTTCSGILIGAGGLSKIGTGKLTLTGSNVYTGSTIISRGELVVDGSLVSPITVGSGGILGGTGNLQIVTVKPGGHLAPGDWPGVLHLSGSLTLATGALLDYDLDTPTTSDLISMPTGVLTLVGQQFSDFHFVPTTSFAPGTYTLIDAGTISIGSYLGTTTGGTIDGYPANLAIEGNDLVLNVVPEPSTLVLLGVGVVGLAAHEWRRRKRSAR